MKTDLGSPITQERGWKNEELNRWEVQGKVPKVKIEKSAGRNSETLPCKEFKNYHQSCAQARELSRSSGLEEFAGREAIRPLGPIHTPLWNSQGTGRRLVLSRHSKAIRAFNAAGEGVIKKEKRKEKQRHPLKTDREHKR